MPYILLAILLIRVSSLNITTHLKLRIEILLYKLIYCTIVCVY